MPGFYERTAFIDDVLLRITSILDGVDPHQERLRLVSELELKAGDRVLEVAAGTGSNLRIMQAIVGPSGSLVGLDLSLAMLKQARRKLKRRASPAAIRAGLVAGDAARLPFRAESFDAVLHFGGINLFEDPRRAIREMARVAKPGARIVISEKSLAGRQEKTFREKLLLKLEPQLAIQPPLSWVPGEMSEVELHWIWNGLMYVLKFRKP